MTASSLNLPDPQDLAAEDIPPAMAQLAALQSQLAARLLAERPRPEECKEEQDTMLTTKQAAAELGVEVDWMYRHAKTLPFTRRLSHKCMRFSRRGLVAWRDRRRAAAG